MASAAGDQRIFAASSRVTDALRQRDGFRGEIHPLSQGYLHVAVNLLPACAALDVALESGRTAVVTNDEDRLAEPAWAAPDQLPPATYVVAANGSSPSAVIGSKAPTLLPAHSCCFILPSQSDAAAGTGRQVAAADTPGPQRVNDGLTVAITALGVGPGGAAPYAVRRATLGQADHVLVFDRIRGTVMAGMTLRGKLHVIPYSYADFDESVDLVSALIGELTGPELCTIAIAVEGNPEILDVAPRLSAPGRRIDIVPARPIALLGAEKVSTLLGATMLGRSYALVSGLPRRHVARRNGLLRELRAYLRARLPCALVEMYQGDLAVVLEALDGLPGERIVAVLSNMFADDEKISCLSSVSLARDPALLDQAARGRLTTVLISGPEPRGMRNGAIEIR